VPRRSANQRGVATRRSIGQRCWKRSAKRFTLPVVGQFRRPGINRTTPKQALAGIEPESLQGATVRGVREHGMAVNGMALRRYSAYGGTFLHRLFRFTCARLALGAHARCRCVHGSIGRGETVQRSQTSDIWLLAALFKSWSGQRCHRERWSMDGVAVHNRRHRIQPR